MRIRGGPEAVTPVRGAAAGADAPCSPARRACDRSAPKVKAHGIRRAGRGRGTRGGERGWRTRALGSERVCVASFRSCSVGVGMEKWTSGRKESSETPRTPSHLPADVVAPRRRVGRGRRRRGARGHTVRKRQISGWTRTATTVFEENVEECVLWIMKNFLKTEQNSASHIRKPWKTSLRKNAQPCPAEMLGRQPPWSAPRPAQGAGEAARPVESDGTPEGGSPGSEAPGGSGK